MSNGFFTSVLLQLAIDYWYFTLIALILKFVLIRFITTDTSLKAIAMFLTGTFVFFAFACLGGFIFSSVNLMVIPFLMFFLALTMESVVLIMVFHTKSKHTFISLAISEFLLFALLFSQVL